MFLNKIVRAPILHKKRINIAVKLVCMSTENKSENYYLKQGIKQTNHVDERPAEWDRAKPYNDIPGPKPLPIIGQTIRFLFGEFKGKDFSEIDKMMWDQYGDISILKGLPGMRDMVLLFNPDDIETMFRNEGIWPQREIMPSIGHYRNTIRNDIYHEAPGILTVHGEEWYKTRTSVNPIFLQPKTVQIYTEPLNAVTADFVNIVRNCSVSSSKNEMPENFDFIIQKWALESVSYIALNRRLGCLGDNPNPEAKALIEAISRFFPTVLIIDYSPLGPIIKKFNLKAWRTFVKDNDFITYTVKKYIDETIQALKLKNYNDPEKEKSILEKLLSVNEKIAITMTIDMIMGGVDTTTKAAGAALYYLSKNKKVQNKLRTELISLLPNPDSPVTTETLSKAPYLKAVIKESLRIAPVTVGNIRTTTKEIVLGGYQIPKGVDVGSIHQLLSISDKHYKRPKEFLPERWLRATTDEEISHKNVNPFVTLPFGFGPRSCVGKRLATLELEVLIAKIVRNFHMDWKHKDMKFVTTLTYGFGEPLKIEMIPVEK